MTSEEMKQTIEFMLEHQAKFDTKQELLQEAQQKTQEDIKTLTGIVTSVAMQIEADHQITQNSINRIETQAERDRQEIKAAVASINNAVIRLEVTVEKMQDQAEKDRQEIRASVSRLEDQANKDRATMTNAISELAKIVGGIHTRVTKVEDKTS
jgi:hypothetical protein